MTPEEKAPFDTAKDDALKPWVINHAWAPADASAAQRGEAAPVRFLLKHKSKHGEKVAKARVIWPVNVISRKLDTGSHLSFFFAANSDGDFGAQTLRAALLQAATLDKHIRLFTAPNRDAQEIGTPHGPQGSTAPSQP